MVRGVWLVAGTPLDAPYPCRCDRSPRGGACHPVHCPCAGRMDLDRVPAGCCGHRVRPHHVAAAQRESEIQRLRRLERQQAQRRIGRTAREKSDAPADG